MTDKTQPIDHLVRELEERAKELNCLYKIEDTLNNSGISLDEAFKVVVDTIPPGWQFPDITKVKLEYKGSTFTSENFSESIWFQRSDIKVNDEVIGHISVYYIKPVRDYDEGPFLKEERKLLNTIAERIGHFILHKDTFAFISELQEIRDISAGNIKHKWQVVLDMLNKTDKPLFNTIIRKLLHNLCWQENREAQQLLKDAGIEQEPAEGEEGENIFDENKPLKKKSLNNEEFVQSVIRLADENLRDEEILAKLQKWMYEDKCSGLVKAVETLETSLNEISEALRKYYPLLSNGELSPSIEKGLKVSLIRRFFTDQTEYISIAKDFVEISDFYDLTDRIILPSKSYGKLGGKSAGMFLASKIIAKKAKATDKFKNIKIPKTWFIPSDGIMHFLHYNELEEVIEQKYKDIEEIRREYPHIVQIFKNSDFTSEFINGVSVALDDFGDCPLVVRSSSLLEDQFGAAFSGKYKSLFIANQGTKQEKLSALLDAISEVYASTFGPDPIEYRAERGLLDFREEMGIMIQEVVGTNIGKYFMPAFAGVAFSNNEFRWSPRIKREDGLIRLVPGLGTRAVDRLGDDYPILLAPGQPNLRVNVSFVEKLKYTPQFIDLIDLKTNEFESHKISDIIKETGNEYPGLKSMVSIVKDNHITQPMGLNPDFQNEDLIITFEGLINNGIFVPQMKLLLDTLQEGMRHPVDIEFASNGKDFYILQCRSQTKSRETQPDPIPRDIPRKKVLFTANKYVSNGKVPEISHIVYVDPVSYNNIGSKEELVEVGRAVSKLNKILPKRKFILMGPGRWGSRGDIKLGVNVTYSDINNTAMLIEVAKQVGNYIPDLSFGTHFFQDLVESSIRYLPLYPDDEDIIFNEVFFRKSENMLEHLVPEYRHLEDTVKVIDVTHSSEGEVLRVLINAELEEAVAFLNVPAASKAKTIDTAEYVEWQPSNYWQWRYKMAERMAELIPADEFGVKGFYIFGSSKNANAGPASDIDLLIHITDDADIGKMNLWFAGWSQCLSELNYLKTGYASDGLLDIHYVTDDDIEKRTSFASKIGAITDPAKQLKIGK
ncbi:MAG: phosphoenolpyruvate synthase [Chlorobi bacterium OLB5]|nr:MAG: phosphoenolpyruvate synthase [Chlorobi bacterium OLB5]